MGAATGEKGSSGPLQARGVIGAAAGENGVIGAATGERGHRGRHR